MDDTINELMKKEFISVWVRDPQLHKEDFWHTYISYEICLHTNSMCFCKKSSCVRRRFSEFVWLRQRLQENALLLQLPKLPPANPFFSISNVGQVQQRMEGLQKFLEEVLQMPLMLSDSRLHLFLQSDLSVSKMDACVLGQTRYSVSQAIQRSVQHTRFPLDEDNTRSFCDSDCDSTSSSSLAASVSPATPIEMSFHSTSPAHKLPATPLQPEVFKSLSSSPTSQEDVHS